MIRAGRFYPSYMYMLAHTIMMNLQVASSGALGRREKGSECSRNVLSRHQWHRTRIRWGPRGCATSRIQVRSPYRHTPTLLIGCVILQLEVSNFIKYVSGQHDKFAGRQLRSPWQKREKQGLSCCWQTDMWKEPLASPTNTRTTTCMRLSLSK